MAATMKSLCWRSGVFVTMLFAVSWSTGCGRSDLLAGPDDEPVNAGGAISTAVSSAGGRSGVAISSSQAGAGGGDGGAAYSSTLGSTPLGGSAGFGGNGGSSPLSSSSTKPVAGAIGGSGGLSALAGSKTSGGAGAIGGSGGLSALAGSKTSGGAGAIGGSSGATGGVSALAGTKASGGASATGGSAVRCSEAKGCGGDVVGTWNVTGSCLSATGQVDLSMLGLSCKSVSIDESLNVTGTWVAMADGTYADKTTTKGSVQFAVPASCLRLSGTTVSCSIVAPVFEALGYGSTTCKDAAGGGCSCATTVNQIGGLGVISESAPTRGAYKTSGNVLAIDGTSRYAYCASATQLTLSPQGTNPPTTGSIVFQKQ